MEVLGTVAAVAQLVDGLKACIEFCETVRKAPNEIKEATSLHNSLRKSSILFSQYAEGTKRFEFASEDQAQRFRCGMKDASILLSKVEHDFGQELRQTRPTLDRFRWASHGKKRVDRLHNKVTEILVFITMSTQFAQLDLLSSIHAKLHQLQTTSICHATVVDLSHTSSAPESSPKQLGELLGDTKTQNDVSEAEKIPSQSSALVACIASARIASSQLITPCDLTVTSTKQDDSLLAACLGFPMIPNDSDIMRAARVGDEVLITQLITQQKGIQNSRTTDYLTPLCFAAENGNIRVVQILLKHGIDVNSCFGKRNSISLCAALNGRQLEMARTLLLFGASYKHLTTVGWSPLFYIWMKEEVQAPATDLLNLLWTLAGPQVFAFHKDIYDESGWGLLHRAAAWGAAVDVVTLIRFGFDPLQRMRTLGEEGQESYFEGWSALRIAVYYGRTDTCTVLLPYYKLANEVNTADYQGWTLLHLAIECRHLDIARLLIEHGADVLARTEPTLSGRGDDTFGYSYTPLLLANESDSDYYDKVCDLIMTAQYKSEDKTPMTEQSVLQV